jgi:hypothetical protein
MAEASVQSPLLLRNKRRIIRNVANVESVTRVNGKKVKSKTTTRTTTGENTNVETVTVVESNDDGEIRIDLNSETVFETVKHVEEFDEEEEREEEEKEDANFTDLIEQMNNASLNGTNKEVLICY